MEGFVSEKEEFVSDTGLKMDESRGDVLPGNGCG